MSAITQKYNSLPRAARWLLLTVGVVVVYFGVVEPVLEATNAAKTRADLLATDLAKERALSSTDSEQGRVLETGRRSFGEPLLPEDKANKPETLHSVVDRILEEHAVAKSTKSERHIRIAGDEAVKLLGSLVSTMTAERLILDISFEATPETVTAVLAALEQAREVAAISRVEIRRQDAGRDPRAGSSSSGSRIVKATISPEAWIVTPSTAAAGGGTRR